MPAVIGFDTATDDTAVAALRDGQAAYASSQGPGADGRPAHATRLLAEVERAAESLGGWDGVERLAVGVGPGSFTGLRIGVATARALALAQGVELAAVGTLDALAAAAALRFRERPMLAALDARRGEVFAAIYGPAMERVREPYVSSPEDLARLLSELPQALLAVGSGALRFRGQLEKGGAEVPGEADPAHRIAAEQICELGAEASASNPDSVTPIYLRPPDAERWRERDKTEH